MIHWSAIPGPIADGFRRQREKQALKLQNQPSVPEPLHSSQTTSSPQQSMPTYPSAPMGQPVRLRPLVPVANPAFQEDYVPEDYVPDDYHQNPTPSGLRPFNPSAISLRPVFPDHDFVDPAAFRGDDHWDQPVQSAWPTREDPIPGGLSLPDSSPIPSIANLRPVTWPPLQPLSPLNPASSGYQGSSAGYPGKVYDENGEDNRPPPNGQPGRYKQDRQEPDSPPRAKSRSYKDIPLGSRTLKRRRSSTSALTRKRNKSFHEEYVDSAKKGGKLPTDIDSFAFQDKNDGEGEHWSTINFFKKQKRDPSHKQDDGTDDQDGRLPSIYTEFQPKFKPKVDKKMVITTSKSFKLPIPAFNALSKNAAAGGSSASNEMARTSTKRRTLFQPPPVNSTKTQGQAKIIEIFDDEEKRKMKTEALKGLESSSLGLTQRAKTAFKDEPTDSKEAGVSPLFPSDVVICTLTKLSFQEYRSSLYKDSKLGDDVEATSCRPFSNLEHFRPEEDKSWTSSPPRETSPSHATIFAVRDAAATVQLLDDTHAPAEGTSANATAQSLHPLAQKWTFKKFFGR